MKFFIDTANLEQIQEAYDLGVLDGVTTNPSLMAKEGIKGTQNQRDHYVKICNIVNGDVSAEVIATDYEGMIREGEELAATVSKTEAEKCPRCWNHRALGGNANHGSVCERCGDALDAIGFAEGE